jgi:spore coat protein U-like protein
MLLKSVLPVLGIATLQAALMCSPGLAATRTASISVSATVVAGCQVSPILSAAKSTLLESKRGETSVSINCLLPVPYQVSITNDSIEESNHESNALLSTGMLTDSIKAGHRIAEDAYSETMTVTVIY